MSTRIYIYNMITVVEAAHCFGRVYSLSETSKTFTTLLYYIILYLKSTHDVPHALFEQMTHTSYMGVENCIYIYKHLTIE